MRAFRRFLVGGDAGALGHDRLSRSACSARRFTACASFRSNSFPPRTGRSCSSTCSCPRTRRSTRRKTSRPHVDKLLKGDQDVDHWSTYVGQGAVRFYLPLNVQLPNDFFAPARGRHQGAAAARARARRSWSRRWRRDFPNVVGRVYPLELGPPVGWPLQYRVSGPDPDQVRAIAFKVARRPRGRPAAPATSTTTGWSRRARSEIRVDQDQARLLGPELASSSPMALNAVVSGVTATQMRSGIYLVDVLVRASAEQRMSLATIRTLQVPLPNGQDRSAEPDRLRRLRPGISHRLAPGPAARP